MEHLAKDIVNISKYIIAEYTPLIFTKNYII